MAFYSGHRAIAVPRCRPVHQLLLAATAGATILLFASNAFAQANPAPSTSAAPAAGSSASHVCQTTTTCSAAPSGSSYSRDCDVRYRNLELKYTGSECERYIANRTSDYELLRSIEGARPAEDKPMKHIVTPLKSLIKDYSPYLFYSLRMKDFSDDADKQKILKRLYRGTAGDARSAFSMVSGQNDAPPTATGVDEQRRQYAQCVDQIRVPSTPTDPAGAAKVARLKLDNCVNQFILYSAVVPAYKENSNRLAQDTATPSARRIGLYSHCQPLRMSLGGDDTINEYHATHYIMGAWKKLLQDPAARINPKAPLEPMLPSGITLENPIAPTSTPDIRVSMLMNTPYEEIIDPSHPFSPRWDFEYNERDKFSPMTAAYDGDPKNGVFCAGDKENKIYKVDVMTFRDDRIKFSEKVKQRIDFNTNCKNGSGLQAKPCCFPYIDGPPNSPSSYKCRLKDCKTCFNFTKEAPTCTTTYTGSPDRKRIRAPFLPVHPFLRMMSSAGSMMQNLSSGTSLTSLPANMNVAQASSVLQSSSGMLSSFGVNTNMGQISGLLQGGVNLSAQLPNMLGGGAINISQLGSLMGAQGNIMSSLGSLNPSQLQGMLSGQVNIMASIPNINIGQFSSYLQMPTNLLSSLPSNLSMSSVTGMLQSQGNILSAIPGASTVTGAISQISSAQSALQGLPQNMSLSNLNANVAAQIPGFGNLNANMNVGQLQQILSSQGTSLAGMNPSSLMSSVAPAINSQINAIVQLPGGVSVQQVGSFLNSAQSNFSQLSSSLGNINMSSLSGSLQTQFGAISGTLSNFNPQQIGSLFSGAGGMFSGVASGLSGMTGGLNISSIQGMVGGQFGNMLSLNGSFNVGQISSIFNTQIGQLSSLSGLTSLGSVAGGLDMSTFGGMGGLGSFGGAGGIGGAASGSSSPCSAGQDVLYLACVVAMPYSNKAACRPDEPSQNSATMASQCEKLRAPVVPLNKLKMRYHDPAKIDESELPSGVPEGLTFKEYFDDPQTQVAHMPYMRLHDTGRSIQKSTNTKQDPMDILGQYTAIVGVGIEGISGNADKKDQRCLFGGWGENTNVGGVGFRKGDPITSWTELKLYQARFQRKEGIYCVPRYEKLYKGEGTEEKALAALGGTFQTTRALTGQTEETRIAEVPWPLAWRGYLVDPDTASQFPNFGGTSPSLITGLDKAKLNDVILLPNNGSDSGGPAGLPKVGIVVEGSRNDPATCGDACWLTIVVGNDGSAPDVCGVTDATGQVITRYLHKPGHIKRIQKTLDDYATIGASTNCEDQNLQHCILSTWDQIKIYRPTSDVRRGAAAGGAAPGIPALPGP